MLSHLDPSVELTGGPWYSENELDTEFIRLLSRACLQFVRDRVRSLSLASIYIPNMKCCNAEFSAEQGVGGRGTPIVRDWCGPGVPKRTGRADLPLKKQDYGDGARR